MGVTKSMPCGAVGRNETGSAVAIAETSNGLDCAPSNASPQAALGASRQVAAKRFRSSRTQGPQGAELNPPW